MTKTFITLALAVFVFSCAKKTTPAATTATVPNPPAAPAAPATTAVAEGQTTYSAKCGKCHALKTVGSYTAEKWVNVMAKMGPMAKLTATETENVLAYVKANAKK